MAEIINRVANSSLITLNLEKDFPQGEIKQFDIKDYLFHGLILKEKDFRTALKELDWSIYQDAHLCLHCSTDAIIPQWAFMLVAAYAKPIVKTLYFGTTEGFIESWYTQLLNNRDYSEYQGERIVIKGCSNLPVPASAYMDLTACLQPYAQSIMYGEPCSTVPVFKRPRVKK